MASNLAFLEFAKCCESEHCFLLFYTRCLRSKKGKVKKHEVLSVYSDIDRVNLSYENMSSSLIMFQ